MEETKTPGEKRRKELFYAPKNGWDRIDAGDEAALRSYCEDYKKFLDESKTEREAVDTAIALAEAKGFRPFARGMALQPGDKVYRSNRGKALMLAVIGSEPLDQGARIGAAHIDSPRLDLKPNPLYEDAELAFLKTHYYGGLRKYQWVTIPLELHGVVALRDGSVVKVAVGAAAGDPLFTIDDLLPHLGAEQSKKPLSEAIPGENLNVLVGWIRRVLDDAGVIWQMAELGKVDAGGGGTVACYMANRDIDTLDAGVPVLSMHSPYETVSKLDCYMTYLGMKAVYQVGR